MRLVKLNRRHKAHKELGHNWAFRWNSYDPNEVYKVEKVLQSIHGSQYSYNQTVWKSGFGCPARGNSYRTYWVSFRNEADATVVLLQMG
jgi:hypothetical protein